MGSEEIPGHLDRHFSSASTAENFQRSSYSKIVDSEYQYVFLHGPPCIERSIGYLLASIYTCMAVAEKKSLIPGTLPSVLIFVPSEEEAMTIFRRACRLSNETSVQCSVIAKDGNVNRNEHDHVHLIVTTPQRFKMAFALEPPRVSLKRASFVVFEEPTLFDEGFWVRFDQAAGAKTLRYVFCGSHARDEDSEILANVVDAKDTPRSWETHGYDATIYTKPQHKWSAFVTFDSMLKRLLLDLEGSGCRVCPEFVGLSIIVAQCETHCQRVAHFLRKNLDRPRLDKMQILHEEMSEADITKGVKDCRNDGVSLVVTTTSMFIALGLHTATTILHVGIPTLKEHIACICRAGDPSFEYAESIHSHLYTLFPEDATEAERVVEQIQTLQKFWNYQVAEDRLSVRPDNESDLRRESSDAWTNLDRQFIEPGERTQHRGGGNRPPTSHQRQTRGSHTGATINQRGDRVDEDDDLEDDERGPPVSRRERSTSPTSRNRPQSYKRDRANTTGAQSGARSKKKSRRSSSDRIPTPDFATPTSSFGSTGARPALGPASHLPMHIERGYSYSANPRQGELPPQVRSEIVVPRGPGYSREAGTPLLNPFERSALDQINAIRNPLPPRPAVIVPREDALPPGIPTGPSYDRFPQNVRHNNAFARSGYDNYGEGDVQGRYSGFYTAEQRGGPADQSDRQGGPGGYGANHGAVNNGQRTSNGQGASGGHGNAGNVTANRGNQGSGGNQGRGANQGQNGGRGKKSKGSRNSRAN